MNENEPFDDLTDNQAVELVLAALSGPTRPLRADQVDGLVASAVQRLGQPLPPLWVLRLCALGLIVLAGLGAAAGFDFRSLAGLAWLLPLVNLLMGPLAGYVIIKQMKSRKEQR